MTAHVSERKAKRGEVATCPASRGEARPRDDSPKGGSRATRTAARPELLSLALISPPNTTVRCPPLLSLFSSKEDNRGKKARRLHVIQLEVFHS